MLSRIKNGMINSDIFGYPVNLNFDKKDSYYKTLFGGIFSIMFYLLIIYLGIEGTLKIKLHLQDTNITYMNSLDLEKFGPVNYN